MSFESILPYIQEFEGGYVNNPADRGGETNFGVSKKAYPNLDIRNLTKEDAAAIFKKDYYDPIGGDNLPDAIKFLAVDAAINHGVGASKKMLAESGGDPQKFLNARANLFNNLIARDPGQKVFMKGWQARLEKNAAIAAKFANSSTAATAATGTQQSADPLSDLSSQGFADDVKWARAQGYDDDTIRKTLQAEPVKQRNNQTSLTAVEDALYEGNTNRAIANLRSANPSFDADISWATKQGYTEDQILETLVPDVYKKYKGAKDKVDKEGALTTAYESGKETVKGLARGARQVFNNVAGDEETLQQLKQEEAAARQDPTRRVREDTVAGTVGGFVPYLAAAAIPGANSIVGAGAIGAATGALQPVVEGESQGQNALLGGAAGGGVMLGGKVLGKALGAAGKSARGGTSEDAAARVAALQEQGINPRLRDVSPLAAKVGAQADRIFGANVGLDDAAGAVQKDIIRNVTKRAGAEADTLGPETYLRAKNANSALYDKSLNGVVADLTKDQAAKYAGAIDDIISKSDKLARNGIAARYADDIDLLKGNRINAAALQDIRSSIGERLGSTATSGAEKQALRAESNSIVDILKQSMPEEQFANWNQARDQNRNLRFLKKAMAATNAGERDLTPARFAQAIKSAFGQEEFSRGSAPYADVLKALNGIVWETSSIPGLGANEFLQVIHAASTGGVSLIANAGLANVALRIVNSRNPKLIQLLMQLPAAQRSAIERAATLATVAEKESIPSPSAAAQQRPLMLSNNPTIKVSPGGNAGQSMSDVAKADKDAELASLLKKYQAQ